MNIEMIKAHVRTIPDFPKPGILFRDITTVYKDADCLQELTRSLTNYYKDKGITKVLGIESRGYTMASILAQKLNAGFVFVRKPGKLPARTVQQSYEKEYGIDTIEIHEDALSPDDVVLIHDDLLATGGTAKAAYNLVQHFHPKKVYMNFIIEIRDEGLHGRDVFEGIDLTTLLVI